MLEHWRAWRAALNELSELERAEQERLRLADLWTMQRNEIASAALRPGEDAQLENERRVLRNVARLSEAVSAAYELLEESETSAAGAVAQALKRLEEAARIDSTLAPVAEALRPAQIAIQEASHELRHYLGNLEADPRRLEEVESRLALIERLKRKYGSTVEEILAFHDDVAARLAALESAGERRAALEAAIAEHEARYRELSLQLRELRQRAARKLSRRVQEELAGLAMPGAVFRILIEPCDPGETGMDRVGFLFSANAGEEPRPLDRVASGGELSRVALAIKTCMAPAETDSALTLVFDEVDAGVGGAAGEMIGRRLRELSRRHQVICVTHLAQIAGLELPFRHAPLEASACHILPVLLPPGVARQAIMTALKEQGIQTSVHYPPIHGFTHYQNLYPPGFDHGLPYTEEVAARELTLPLYPHLTEPQVATVAAALESCLSRES